MCFNLLKTLWLITYIYIYSYFHSTKDLDMGMVQDCHEGYTFYQMYSEPEDVGFGGIARRRTWVAGSHDERTVCRHDLYDLQEILTNTFRDQIQTTVSDYLVANKNEVTLEAQHVARVRSLNPFIPPENEDHFSLLRLLTQRELQTKNGLDDLYMARFHSDPSSNANLTYFLGDSLSYSATWSALSGKIPTYRLNSSSGKYWLPSRRRWLTAKERLCSMGYPVTKEMSLAMNVPQLFAGDVGRASDMAGNAMHFQTSGILQLLVLSCFGPSNWTIAM